MLAERQRSKQHGNEWSIDCKQNKKECTQVHMKWGPSACRCLPFQSLTCRFREDWIKLICIRGFIWQASTENQRTKVLVWFFKVVTMLRIMKSSIKICYISMKLNSIWLDVNLIDLTENRSRRKCLKSKLSVISYMNYFAFMEVIFKIYKCSQFKQRTVIFESTPNK